MAVLLSQGAAQPWAILDNRFAVENRPTNLTQYQLGWLSEYDLSPYHQYIENDSVRNFQLLIELVSSLLVLFSRYSSLSFSLCSPCSLWFKNLCGLKKCLPLFISRHLRFWADRKP